MAACWQQALGLRQPRCILETLKDASSINNQKLNAPQIDWGNSTCRLAVSPNLPSWTLCTMYTGCLAAVPYLQNHHPPSWAQICCWWRKRTFTIQSGKVWGQRKILTPDKGVAVTTGTKLPSFLTQSAGWHVSSAQKKTICLTLRQEKEIQTKQKKNKLKKKNKTWESEWGKNRVKGSKYDDKM